MTATHTVLLALSTSKTTTCCSERSHQSDDSLKFPPPTITIVNATTYFSPALSIMVDSGKYLRGLVKRCKNYFRQDRKSAYSYPIL